MAFSLCSQKLQASASCCGIWVGAAESEIAFSKASSDYICRHSDELSENRKQWLYTNASNKVNLQIFRVSAKKLRESGITSRDNYSADQLFQVRQLEDVAIALIDEFDVEPTEAVQQAAERILLTHVRRQPKPC